MNRVLSDGVLHRGLVVLVSPVPLDPGLAGEATLLGTSRFPADRGGAPNLVGALPQR